MVTDGTKRNAPDSQESVAKKPKLPEGTVVWWVRNDLRLEDNPIVRLAMGEALTDGVACNPVFIFDPRFLDRSPYGRVTDPEFKKSIKQRKAITFDARKTGALRARFWLQCVNALARELEKKGSKLIVCHGKPEDVLGELPSGSRVFCQSEPVSIEQTDVEDFTEEALQQKGSKLTRDCGAMSLYHEVDLPFKLKDRPSCYSSLAKTLGWKDIWTTDERYNWAAPVRPPVPAPSSVAKTDDLKLPGQIPPNVLADDTECLRRLGYSDIEIKEAMAQTAMPKGGEPTVRTLLEEWVVAQAIDKKSDTAENVVFWDLPCAGQSGPVDGHDPFQWVNLSLPDGWLRISHYMAVGCISAREIFARAYETRNFIGVAHRLMWREFHRLTAIKYHRQIAWLQGPGKITREWSWDMDQARAWKEGRTGLPYIDACMRELQQTGWLAYKGRKTSGHFLVFDLGIDWRIGAFHYEEVLLDYDFAMNYGNWIVISKVDKPGRWGQYRADMEHSDLKSKLGAEKVNDPAGAYIRRWVPELRHVPNKYIHNPWEMPEEEMEKCGCVVGRNYPAPLIGALSLDEHQDEEWEKISVTEQNKSAEEIIVELKAKLAAKDLVISQLQKA